jgi:hypothetical protein
MVLCSLEIGSPWRYEAWAKVAHVFAVNQLNGTTRILPTLQQSQRFNAGSAVPY